MWKSAAVVFEGGSVAARSLKGKRVKAVQHLRLDSFDPTKAGHQGAKVDIQSGQQGFVGWVPADALDLITLAFSTSPQLPSSLEALSRGSFFSVRVNWPTFRQRFLIDV